MPEKTRNPRAFLLTRLSSPSRGRRSGRKESTRITCSQKTITSESKRSFSGMRQALSLPHRAEPRPTSHGPYDGNRAPDNDDPGSGAGVSVLGEAFTEPILGPKREKTAIG